MERADSGEFVEKGIIEPPVQYFHDSSEPSGKAALLKNGQILTYFDCYDGICLWDSETLSCIKKWRWSDIELPKKFYVWNISIIPFSDCVHLLIQQNNDLHLFNMHTMVMSPLKVNFTPADYPHPHLLPNDRVLAFTTTKVPANHCFVAPFDAPILLLNQKIMQESKHLVQLFFSRKKIPPEISRQICRYAFDEESKEELAENLDDNRDNNQEKCLVM